MLPEAAPGCGVPGASTIHLTGSGAAGTGTERSAEGQARVVSGKGGVHVLTVAEASR